MFATGGTGVWVNDVLVWDDATPTAPRRSDGFGVQREDVTQDTFRRIALTGLLCVALGGLALAPSVILTTYTTALPPPPPPAQIALPPPLVLPHLHLRTSSQDLDEQLADITGPEALDCGRLDDRATAKMIRAALACGLNAARSGRPFVLIKSEYGIDSWIPHGLVRGRSEPVLRFSHDDHVPGRDITTEPCPSPVVKWHREFQQWTFSCAK